MDINCEVFNKHVLFIYNNAVESYSNNEYCSCCYYSFGYPFHPCLQHHYQCCCAHLDYHHLCHQHFILFILSYFISFALIQSLSSSS